jgi:hypothetical protein
MAPEQNPGKQGDASTGIYALEIILYEILTENISFYGNNILSLMKQHRQSIPISLQKLQSSIPPEIEAYYSSQCA